MTKLSLKEREAKTMNQLLFASLDRILTCPSKDDRKNSLLASERLAFITDELVEVLKDRRVISSDVLPAPSSKMLSGYHAYEARPAPVAHGSETYTFVKPTPLDVAKQNSIEVSPGFDMTAERNTSGVDIKGCLTLLAAVVGIMAYYFWKGL